MFQKWRFTTGPIMYSYTLNDQLKEGCEATLGIAH